MKDDLSELLEQDASTLGKVFENGLARVIAYNETLWLSFDEVGQQYCKDIWIAKYTPVPGVAIIALQLIPDSEEEIAAAMFGGAAPRKPYIAWQQRLDKPRSTLKLECCLTCKRPLP